MHSSKRERTRWKTGARQRDGAVGGRNEEGGGAKINEEERARWGGFEKEGKRPRVISVHRGLACTARCHVTGALHFSVTSR